MRERECCLLVLNSVTSTLSLDDAARTCARNSPRRVDSHAVEGWQGGSAFPPTNTPAGRPSGGVWAQPVEGEAIGRAGGDGDRSDTIDVLSRLSAAMCALNANPECRLSTHLLQFEKIVDSMWVSAREVRSRATLLRPEQMAPAVEAMATFLRDADVHPEDGFDMFDVDKDGRISFGDLLRSGEATELEVTEEDFRSLFKALGLGVHENIDRLRRQSWISAARTHTHSDALCRANVDCNCKALEYACRHLNYGVPATCACMHACMYACTRALTPSRTCNCMCMHLYAHTCAYAPAYIHPVRDRNSPDRQCLFLVLFSHTCIFSWRLTLMHSAHRQLWVRVIREANELEDDLQESLDWAEMAMKRAEELALEGDVDGAAR